MILLLALASVLGAQHVSVSQRGGLETVMFVNDTDETVEAAAVCYMQESGIPHFALRVEHRIAPGDRAIVLRNDSTGHGSRRVSDYFLCGVIRPSRVELYDERLQKGLTEYFTEKRKMAAGEAWSRGKVSFFIHKAHDSPTFDSTQIANALALLPKAVLTDAGQTERIIQRGRAEAEAAKKKRSAL
ncbi:MAG: hypothetical protein KDC27_05580 [Acidobacteria bacterium]|nr:hypothetical protein [Acidobacteriota bacterium]